MSLVKVDHVNYYFQDGSQQRYILKDISCDFERGVFYTILGASGSGKTTLLSLLSALDSPKSGQILYDGKTLSDLGLESYRRNNIGIVFQQYNLVKYMTAVENIQVAMGITDNQLPPAQKEVAYNLLDYFGITKEKASRTVNKLSGGEQQRVAIARALATNVDVILADEPTGNLNEEMTEEIVEIFKDLAHVHNKCVIVVTHSNMIADESDVVYRLSKGAMVQDNSHVAPPQKEKTPVAEATAEAVVAEAPVTEAIVEAAPTEEVVTEVPVAETTVEASEELSEDEALAKLLAEMSKAD